MSKNGLELLVVIALAFGFVGYCNYADRQRQAPGSFERLLVGSWTSNETAVLDDGSQVPVRLQIEFSPDHSWKNSIHEAAGTSISHRGTWRLRNDPDLTTPSSSRILVLTGLGPAESEHLVVFAGQEILTQLFQSQPEEMRRWQRVQ